MPYCSCHHNRVVAYSMRSTAIYKIIQSLSSPGMSGWRMPFEAYCTGKSMPTHHHTPKDQLYLYASRGERNHLTALCVLYLYIFCIFCISTMSLWTEADFMDGAAPGQPGMVWLHGTPSALFPLHENAPPARRVVVEKAVRSLLDGL